MISPRVDAIVSHHHFGAVLILASTRGEIAPRSPPRFYRMKRHTHPAPELTERVQKRQGVAGKQLTWRR